MGGRIKSPCVGVCSTTLGDVVCRGCQRSDVEIRDWPAMSSDERERRLSELDAMRASVAAQFVTVIDAMALQEQLQRHRIRFREGQPALSRVVELLRVGRGRIRDLSCYGLQAQAKLDAAALHDRITDELRRRAGYRRSLTER